MVKVWIGNDNVIPTGYYKLTGRWYVSPTEVLFLEVITKYTWLGKPRFTDFVSESNIREIQGVYCK